VHGHLEKALSIGFQLGSLCAMQQATTELLDANPAAILLLDESKRIVYANRRAEALRSHHDGIQWSAHGVMLYRKEDHDRLQGLILRVRSTIASVDGSAGEVMRASRPSGKLPYTILVVPVSKRYPALSLLRPAVCIVITDPEGQTPLPVHRVQAAFALTGAEARLACALATGAELRSAASEMKITYGTARARLAQIFEKTGTRRQGELIKVLLTTLSTV
jgi:DNA-binding CsgD family transcriptional regulator